MCNRQDAADGNTTPVAGGPRDQAQPNARWMTDLLVEIESVDSTAAADVKSSLAEMITKTFSESYKHAWISEAGKVQAVLAVSEVDGGDERLGKVAALRATADAVWGGITTVSGA